MMRGLFKKNKEIRISPKYYLLLQDKWAKKMSALTRDLSKKRLVFYLILFVVITGGMSIYNLYKGFFSNDYKRAAIGIISKSNPVIASPVWDKASEKVLRKKESESITSFRFYFQSLKESQAGKKTHDSIEYYRPGLIDSLVFIENYYKVNLKK